MMIPSVTPRPTVIKIPATQIQIQHNIKRSVYYFQMLPIRKIFFGRPVYPSI